MRRRLHAGKQGGEVKVPEVADPVGHTEVAQVDDGQDVAPQQVSEREVRKVPIETAGRPPRAMDRRPVAQHAEAQLLHAIETACSGQHLPISSTRVAPPSIVGSQCQRT